MSMIRDSVKCKAQLMVYMYTCRLVLICLPDYHCIIEVY